MTKKEIFNAGVNLHSSSLGSSCVTLTDKRSTRSCKELTLNEKLCASLKSSPNMSSAYLPEIGKKKIQAYHKPAK